MPPNKEPFKLKWKFKMKAMYFKKFKQKDENRNIFKVNWGVVIFINIKLFVLHLYSKM